MAKRVNELYTPSELRAVLAVLTDNAFHNFQESEAAAIVKMLHQRGYRIVQVAT